MMAVKEVRNFLENGNIKNSVNFPNCDMGTCVAVGRIAITHKNIPNMISQVTKILGSEGLNIADMTNKSKGEYAYTLIDLESAASQEALEALESIDEDTLSEDDMTYYLVVLNRINLKLLVVEP